MNNNLEFKYKVYGDVTKIKDKKILGIFTTRHCTNYSKKIIKDIVLNFHEKYCFMLTYETFERLYLKNEPGEYILIYDSEELPNTKKDSKVRVFLNNDIKELRLKYLYKDLFISTKSDGILILEATKFSKNLNILTLYAQELGKEVYVLPGRIDSDSSEGSNKLIFDGANPLYTLDLLNI